MRTLFRLLVLAVLAVGLAIAARYNEGYVLLVMPPWRAELSLNFFLLLAVLGFTLGYFFVRMVWGGDRFGTGVIRARKPGNSVAVRDSAGLRWKKRGA